MQFKSKKQHYLLLSGLVLVVLLVAVAILTVVLRLLGGGAGINVQIARAPACLDPARMSSYEEKLINGAIYESLVDYDSKQHKGRGSLAEKWATEDGKGYTFTLRKNARFQNGTLVTARDVKYSWERVLDSHISNYGYLLQNVVGAEARMQGDKGEIRGLQVVDDRTLRVTLNDPDYTFPAVVSSPALAIVSKQVVLSCGTHYGQADSKVIGSGPFSLVRWEKSTLLLNKNTRYPGSHRLIRELHFIVVSDSQQVKQLFESGKVDILAGAPAGMSPRAQDRQLRRDCTVYQKPVLSLYFLGFRLGQTPFSKSWELRKAVDLALDRQDLTTRLLGDGGRPLNRFVPLELYSGSTTSGSVTMQKNLALQHLADAGYPYGLHLSPVTFSYNDSPGHEFLARLLQGQLSQVGIDLHLRKIPWPEYVAEIRSGADAFFRLGWDADYAEPGNLLYNNFASGLKGCNNFTAYSSKALDDQLHYARAQQDPVLREASYRKAEQMVLIDIPVIPLFQRVDIFILGKNVQGFDVDLLGRINFTRLSKAG